MSRTPEVIVKYFNMVEDADDPRWKGTSKRVWRSGRGRSGMLFMEWHDTHSLQSKSLLELAKSAK